MGDDPQWEPAGAGLADPVQLEERGAGDQPVLAQPDQEGGVALIWHQPGRRSDLGELAGQVDQPLAMPVRPSGQHQQPIGAQQDVAGHCCIWAKGVGGE